MPEITVGGVGTKFVKPFTEATAVINVGLIKDHSICGYTGCLKNMTHGSINVPHEHHAHHASPQIAKIYARYQQVLTGNGNASKSQLERAVRLRLNHPVAIRPLHAADALGLAIIGLLRWGGHPAHPALQSSTATRRHPRKGPGS